MKQTEENIDWAISKIEQLSTFPGAPEKPEHILTHAKQLLRIVDTNEPCYLCCGGKVSVSHYENAHMKDDDTAKAKTDVTYLPGEWLIDECLSRFKRFPMPVEIRGVFVERRIPDDKMMPPNDVRWDR